MPLRLAIISTPRSGSTWIRQLLKDLYAIAGLDACRPDDVDWAGLPPECVLQLHWRRTPALLRRLEEENFRVLTVARHPLDVLISILQFCLHDASTLQWMDGEGGGERPIQGAMPGSAVFREYTASPRAAALMAVTQEWWAAPRSLKIRYEEMVANPVQGLGRITEALGEPARRPVAEVISNATILKLQVQTGVPHHFWQGRPGLWKALLVAPVAEQMAQACRSHCAAFGYACDPDPELTPVQADANWLGLTQPQVTDKLQRYRTIHQELGEAREALAVLQAQDAALQAEHAALEKGYLELQSYCTQVEQAYEQQCAAWRAADEGQAEMWVQLAAMQGELARTQGEMVATRGELAAAQAELAATQAELARRLEVGPASRAAVMLLRRLSHRYPVMTSAAKRILRLQKQVVSGNG